LPFPRFLKRWLKDADGEDPDFPRAPDLDEDVGLLPVRGFALVLLGFRFEAAVLLLDLVGVFLLGLEFLRTAIRFQEALIQPYNRKCKDLHRLNLNTGSVIPYSNWMLIGL